MTNILIFGISSFSQLMQMYVERFTNDNIIGFVCHKKYISSYLFNNKPVFAIEDLNKEVSRETKILLSMGYTKMNTLRKEFASLFLREGFQFYEFVHPSAKIYSSKIGSGNIIFENVTTALGSEIGDFNVIFNDCSISHHCKIGDFNHLSVAVALSGNVSIGCHCFLGTNATIKNNICVSNYTLLGANAYLDHNSQEYGVYVPSRSVQLKDKKSVDLI